MSGPALLVCLNPAIDLTYRVPVLRPGTSHRVSELQARAGGKPVNIARVLARLGVPSLLLSYAGGPSGAQLREELATADIAARFVPTAGASRRTVTVVDDEDATVFNEPGPQIRALEWEAMTGAVTDALGGAGLLVLAGSVPPGSPPDAYAQLVRLAHEHGVATLLDADGSQLSAALAAAPALVKPNRDEVGALLGTRPGSVGELASAAQRLRELGAVAAIVSAGADGLVAATADRTSYACGPARLTGNPTGAGDAMSAALVRGMLRADRWDEVLRDAVALSGAAVVTAVAGEFDPETARRLRPGVRVQEL